MYVENFMTEDPITVSPDVPVDEAWKRILSNRVRQLPVSEGDDELVGIVSRTDLLRTNPTPGDGVDDIMVSKVSDIMTPDPYTISRNTSIEGVAAKMNDRQVGALPVVDGPKVVGIITRTDIFQFLSSLLGMETDARRLKFEEETFSECLASAEEQASGEEPISFVSFLDPEKSGWQNALSIRKQER